MIFFQSWHSACHGKLLDCWLVIFFVCVLCLIIIIVTMFRNTYQKGFLTVFSSTGSKPLANWSSHVKNGHIKRITDCDLTSLVLELMGRNVATTYICTPCPGYCSLGIKLPFLTLIVKNLKKFFTFEIQVYTVYLFMFPWIVLLYLLLYVRLDSRWQKSTASFSCIKLSVNYSSEAVLDIDAVVFVSGLESNSI